MAAAGDPVDGGTLRFASASGPGGCIDPHQSPADIAGFYTRPIVDSLVALNEDGTLDPWLATEWNVSPDQLTYSFTLRDDVTFSNGEKFDGNAVKANLDHIVNPATKSQLAANTIATYTGASLPDVTSLVQDSIFSRSPQDGTRTGIFIAGKNAEEALDMVDRAKKALVPPFANHIFADPAGSFTTGAAMVGLLRSFTVNVFDVDSPFGQALIRHRDLASRRHE